MAFEEEVKNHIKVFLKDLEIAENKQAQIDLLQVEKKLWRKAAFDEMYQNFYAFEYYPEALYAGADRCFHNRDVSDIDPVVLKVYKNLPKDIAKDIFGKNTKAKCINIMHAIYNGYVFEYQIGKTTYHLEIPIASELQRGDPDYLRSYHFTHRLYIESDTSYFEQIAEGWTMQEMIENYNKYLKEKK